MMTPVYRVTQDFHNPQYFLFRSEANLFASDKPYATVDIVYVRNMDEARKKVDSTQPW